MLMVSHLALATTGLGSLLQILASTNKSINIFHEFPFPFIAFPFFLADT
jgi:hypothetical protein